MTTEFKKEGLMVVLVRSNAVYLPGTVLRFLADAEVNMQTFKEWYSQQ